MKPLSIIDGFQELRHCRSDMIEVAVSGPVDLLLLQGLHEALSHSVVVGASRSAHAGQNAVPIELEDIVEAGILDTAIRMMDQGARDYGSAGERHVQRLDGQRRLEMIV